MLEKNSSQSSVVNDAEEYFCEKETENYYGNDVSLNKYLNEKAISDMIKVNSEIERILNRFKISVKINMGILNNLVKNHLPDTKKVAMGIADNLPQNYQSAINRKALAKATSLHDIAKVIMPEDIINKAGILTENERRIMQKHSTLSYELLKTTDLDEETLNLIKNHHHSPKKTEYCKLGQNFISDINLQILSIADIYSALREKRSYKKALDKEQALEIINEEVKQGKFHPCIYKALVEYADKVDSNKFNPQRQVLNLKPVNSLSA